jgi:hypothetical protein
VIPVGEVVASTALVVEEALAAWGFDFPHPANVASASATTATRNTVLRIAPTVPRLRSRNDVHWTYLAVDLLDGPR